MSFLKSPRNPIGRDVFGGKDMREIEHAIQQLTNTRVIETMIDEKKGNTRKINYSLVVTSGLITEVTNGRGRVQTVALQGQSLLTPV